MHNNIMAAGSKDRPPMLGPGRYSQWRSRFLRYIDTKPNGGGLKKCIINGPYVPTSVLIQAVPEAEGRPAVQQHTAIETVLNMTPENKEHFQSEKEAIFLLLTGIGDEIYSTVDACNTANEMWIAIERLQQGESLNVQDVKTNLFWEFGKFTSQDGESMESYYSRFYKLMNELTRNNLQVTTMQFQKEVNDIRAERIAKSANPLALLAAAQPYSDTYYQAPKPQRSNATSSSTRQSASTRHKGKEVAKPITPQSESVSEEDSDPEQAQRDKEMQKNLALLAKYFKKLYKPTNNNLRTSSNSRNKTEDTTPRYNNDNQSRQFGNQRTMTVAGARETVGSQVVQQTGIQCFNCKGYGHYAKECRKPKRVKDYAYHKEKMMMCKQAEQGVPLQAEQADWLEDTDEEIDEQELEAHYSYMAKIQEVSPEESSSTGQPLEQVDQNASECVDERVALANLIANLTLDTEENKTVLKQLKKANASLTQELKECKTNLDESSRALGEATSSRDSSLIALQNKQTELRNQPLLIQKYSRKLNPDKPRLYEIPYDNSVLQTEFAPNEEETVTLKRSISQYCVAGQQLKKLSMKEKCLLVLVNPEKSETKSVANPIRKQLHQIPLSEIKSYIRILYENYKSGMEMVDAKEMSISTIVSRITNVLKISNFIGSNLSNIPSSSNSLADCTTHPIHCTDIKKRTKIKTKPDKTEHGDEKSTKLRV
ncbi:retrovirus-related pol polyprotein from transposon TNT 1-94 [Tanacetum coccineum]